MARSRTNEDPDVKVHITAGCDLCGETGKHTHSQRDWREHVDNTPMPWDKGCQR